MRTQHWADIYSVLEVERSSVNLLHIPSRGEDATPVCLPYAVFCIFQRNNQFPLFLLDSRKKDNEKIALLLECQELFRTREREHILLEEKMNWNMPQNLSLRAARTPPARECVLSTGKR
jgi:hypothetical protein